MKTRTLALGDCYVAPENARAGIPAENVDELAANIAEYGVLQPLVGYIDPDGRLAVCAGRRRLAALNKLAEDSKGAKRGKKIIPEGYEVPFREIDQAAAAGASLAENTERVALGIVEEVQAFARMSIDGKETSSIARAFGVTERFVNGRIKLASLHEPILGALRTGDISLDVAQIYAGAHPARQEKVWKALGKIRQRRSHDIKDALKANTIFAGDPIAKFVGEDAYLAAGGQVETELFLTADMSRWLNPEIAERLAQEKLQAIGAEAGAGFAFVETGIEVPSHQFVDGNLGKKRKATKEESERKRAIDARLKAISKETREFYSNNDDDFDRYGDEADAKDESWAREREALVAEQHRIEADLVTIPEDARAKSGVVITIDADGAPLIRRGVVTPKDRKAPPAGKSATKKGKHASAKPSRPEPQAPMTNLTHEKTSRIASTIVGRALAANPAIALVAVTAQAAREVFFYGTNQAMTIRGFDQGAAVEGLLSDKDAETTHTRWEVALGTNEDALEEKLAKWSQPDVLELLAYCVGQAVKVVEPTAAADYSDASDRLQLKTLGKLAGANPAAHFIPDADYLEGYSKPSLEAAAAELSIDSAGVKTKKALAAMIADQAKGGGATAAWVPPLLRTLCGMDEKPKAKPKAAAKGGAKKKAVKKSAAKKVAKAAPKKTVRAKPTKKTAAKARA